MKIIALFFAITCSFVTGCAGSTDFSGCEPKVCGADCGPGEACTGELTLSPGGSATVKATLSVEGSHAGQYTFTTSAVPPVSATVAPSSADVADGTPQDVVVTVTVDATAMPGLYSAQLTATNADAETSAGTSISIRVPMP